MTCRKMFRAKIMGRIGFAVYFQCSFRCERFVAARKVTKTPFKCSVTEGGKMEPQQARQRQVRIFLVRGPERAAE